MRKYDEEYRRNLPHIQPDDGLFAITYRIKGTIPKSIIDFYDVEYEKAIIKSKEEIIAKQLFFDITDSYLDSGESHNYLLKGNISQIVVDSLKYYEGKYYKLIAYCIMSNHVHVIIDKQGFESASLTSIFGSIKGYSAYLINRELRRDGHFWSAEIYDHIIKSEGELESQIKYVINNPVKAGLVNHWRNWNFTFVDEEYIDF